MALPLVDRIRADLDVRVALVHSGLGDGERADEWRRIRAGDVDVVVGTRLAVLSPLASLGVVIVDEEHDAAYKSDRTPRLQARDVAIRLAEAAGAACVLGSATPAVDTEGHARSGRYRRVELRDRASGAAPVVRIVDLREELAAGERGLLSRPLAEALAALDPDDRRAGHPRPQPARDRVDRPVPRLRPRPGLPGLRAIRSSTTRPGPPSDATTAAAPRRSRPAVPPAARRGSATWAVARNASSARSATGSRACASVGSIATSSSARAPRSASSMPSSSGRLDVLVGTSLVAKGLDVPSVTLVGVVSSDVALNLPDERAAEADLPAARAGRGQGRPGRPARPGVPADVPARAPGHRGRPDRGCPVVLRRRARSSTAVRVAAVRATGQVDGRADRPGRGGTRSRRHGRQAPGAGRRSWIRRGRRRSGPGLRPATGGSVALERRPAR